MRLNKLVTQLKVIVFLSALHKTSAVMPGMVADPQVVTQVGTEEIIPAVGRLIKNYCNHKNATEQDMRDLYLNIQLKLTLTTFPQENPQIQAILEMRDFLNTKVVHRNQDENINEQGVKECLVKYLEVISPDDHGNSRTQVSSEDSQSSNSQNAPLTPKLNELGEGYNGVPFTGSELPRGGHEGLIGDPYNNNYNDQRNPSTYEVPDYTQKLAGDYYY